MKNTPLSIERSNSTNPFDLTDYYQTLEQHDWTYCYSDDPTRYQAGKIEARRLRAVANYHREADKLYTAFSNSIFTDKAKPPIPQPQVCYFNMFEKQKTI